MSPNKTSQVLVFDECVDHTYKPIFEEAGFSVLLSSRSRRVRGRKSFQDPEIFENQGFKYPVVTRDKIMVDSENKRYKSAGKIVLHQTQKGSQETEYKQKVKEFMSSENTQSLRGHKIDIPVSGVPVKIKWE